MIPKLPTLSSTLAPSVSQRTCGCAGLFALMLASCFGMAGHAQSVQSTVTVGQGPVSANVNPVTNKIYVANLYSNSVSVIDGATNGVTNVPVGAGPTGVAINPVTNKIYSADDGGGTVTVIDGVTNTIVTSITVPDMPQAVALNPLTNKIYVICNAAFVDVIDGATNLITARVPLGAHASALAINPVTNKIYVAMDNGGTGNTLAVLDGASNTITTVPVGRVSVAVAVNPATNKIYVANASSDNVTVIDGASNTTATVTLPTGSNPLAIAVDTILNEVYVANLVGNTITVINGGTNGAVTLAAGTGPNGVEVNEITGQVYVANSGDGAPKGSVTVLDEATLAMTTLETGGAPEAMGINPVTNKVYVANQGVPATGIGTTVTVIDGAVNKTTASSVEASTYSVPLDFDPVRKELFTTNYSNGTVSIYDMVNKALVGTVTTGPNPESIAINPVTAMVYVGGLLGGGIATFSEAGGAVTRIDASDPSASGLGLAVNPVTNKIYAISYNQILVVDGATNAYTSIPNFGGPEGADPHSLAVNPVTNKVYGVNYTNNNVTVLDGATNAVSTVGTGAAPLIVAVNPVTNKIYVTNSGSGNVTVIDGATNSTTTLNTGTTPTFVAVNSQTNMIYVTNRGDGTLSIINGATNVVRNLGGFVEPLYVAVNPLLNLIYVNSASSGAITVVDGVTNTILNSVPAGSLPYNFALDPFNNEVYETYAPSMTSDSLLDLAPNKTQAVPLTTTIQGVVDGSTVGLDNVFQTTSNSPEFTVAVESDFIPANPFNTTNPPPTNLYYRVDGGGGPGDSSWQKATLTVSTGNLADFDVKLANIPAGLHVLYVFAEYGNVSGLGGSSDSNGSAVKVGNTTACYFLVTTSGTPVTGTPPPCLYGNGMLTPAPTRMTMTCVPPTIPLGGTALVTATVTTGATVGMGIPTGTVSFTDTLAGTTTPLLSEPLLNGVASLTYDGLVVGTHTITGTYTPIGNFLPSTASCTETVTLLPTNSVLTITPAGGSYGTPLTLTATVTPATPPGQGAPTGTVTFYNGTTAIGMGTLASGVASIPFSLTTGVSYDLTCTYNGSAVYATSDCNSIPFTPSTFTIALNPSTITLPSGVTGTVQILLGSVGNFAGPLALTLGAVPANATVSIAPTTVTLTAGGTANTTLTLNVLLALNDVPGRPGQSRMPEVFTALMLLAVPLGLARRRKLRVLGVAMLAVGLMGMTGCTNTWYIKNEVAPGTYQIPVTATDMDKNSKTAVLTVIVKP